MCRCVVEWLESEWRERGVECEGWNKSIHCFYFFTSWGAWHMPQESHVSSWRKTASSQLWENLKLQLFVFVGRADQRRRNQKGTPGATLTFEIKHVHVEIHSLCRIRLIGFSFSQFDFCHPPFLNFAVSQALVTLQCKIDQFYTVMWPVPQSAGREVTTNIQMGYFHVGEGAQDSKVSL